MTKFDPLRVAQPRMNRRHFLYGASAGLFVLGTSHKFAWAQSPTQSVLSGTEFNLEIGEMPVNFTGRARTGIVVNGQVPAPLLRWREGETVTLRVANRLATRLSLIHISEPTRLLSISYAVF